MSAKSLFEDIPSHTRSVIFAFEGPRLSEEEIALFRDVKPLGFILFDKPGTRNIENPAQLRALTDELRECLGWNCPILIDQEGGRVQRLKPPHWRAFSPAKTFGDRAAENPDKALEELRFHTLQMAEELLEAGINVNCTPVVDVLFPQTHDVIGDRAFSTDPELVGRLALSVCNHYLAAGMMPIIKHIPGHGRAEADSHHALPVVKSSIQDLRDIDFKAFKIIAESEIGNALWAMTAHVVYEALDSKHPATTSPDIIRDIIRGEIGFNGVLLSDDLDMKALDMYGDIAAKASACLEAGCDAVLHCSGDFESMKILGDNVPELTTRSRERLQYATKIA